MAYALNITADHKIFFDTDKTLSFQVFEGDPTAEQIAAGEAVPIDVSGWSIGWTLRKKTSSATALIEKTTDNGGITITGAFGSPNTQRVEVLLEDTDTYNPDASPSVNIKAGTYAHALKRLDPGAEGILAWGSFVLLQAAAWEPE